MGRTDTNKVTIFPKDNSHIGDLVKITIDRCNSATLFGTVIKELKTMDNYRIAVNS
jgi:tRNA A37 methylthiotransferase MiaB